MAKVVLPLLSVEARGKIGDAMVFFPLPHCEQAVVRRWLKPTNPQSASQGDVRIKAKSTGYNNSFIVNAATLQTQIAAVTPSGQTWAAYYIKQQHGASFATWDADRTEFDGLTNTAEWESDVAGLGMVDQDISYADEDPVTPGEVVYHAAKAAYRLGLACAATDPAVWTTAGGEITDFVGDYTT